jgi:hypothetical protein
LATGQHYRRYPYTGPNHRYSQFTFAAAEDGPLTIKTKLVYRRAFQQLAEWKGWDDPDLMMAENMVTVEN